MVECVLSVLSVVAMMSLSKRGSFGKLKGPVGFSATGWLVCRLLEVGQSGSGGVAQWLKHRFEGE